MKPKNILGLLAAAIASLLAFDLPARAATSVPAQAPAHERFGATQIANRMDHVEIRNLRDERLGRVKEVAIDLPSGRIVEVLVVSGEFLGLGGKVTAIPPAALIPDLANKIYWLNVSKERFASAPAIKLSDWGDHGRSDKVAAVYRYFGVEPFFLETGKTANLAAARPLVQLGPIARSSKIMGMRVENLKGRSFGIVAGLKLDITAGRVLGVIIESATDVMGKRLVPAMALAYSPDRANLLLDDTAREFNDEPAYATIDAAYGQPGKHKEETATGPVTKIALEQGVSYRDIDRTLLINRMMRAGHLPSRNVEVGTLYGRVTLRGWVPTEAVHLKIVEIAVASSRLELVDDQLIVGPRPASSSTSRP